MTGQFRNYLEKACKGIFWLRAAYLKSLLFMPSPTHPLTPPQWARSHLKVAAFSFFPPRLRKKIENYSKAIAFICLCTYTHCDRWASLLPQVGATSLPLQRQIVLVASLQRHKNFYQLSRYFYRGKKNCAGYFVTVARLTVSLLLCLWKGTKLFRYYRSLQKI